MFFSKILVVFMFIFSGLRAIAGAPEDCWVTPPNSLPKAELEVHLLIKQMSHADLVNALIVLDDNEFYHSFMHSTIFAPDSYSPSTGKYHATMVYYIEAIAGDNFSEMSIEDVKNHINNTFQKLALSEGVSVICRPDYPEPKK